MPGTVMVYDPSGQQAMRTQGLTPRLESLRGKTVGMIDNGMAQVNLLFADLADLLTERAGIEEVIVRQKPTMSKPASPDIIDELTRRSHFAITGVGV